MSSGKVHADDSINLMPLTFAVTSAGYVWGLDWGAVGVIAGMVSALGCMSGILFTPDLDMETRTLVERIPVLGWVWSLFWYPYALLIPHRSPLSHNIIIGTIGRQLYFWGIIYLICLLVGQDVYVITNIIHSPLYWSWLCGVWISDVAHAIRDLS